MITNISQKIACKHRWFKHAIETGSMTVLKGKINEKFIFLLGNQHRILYGLTMYKQNTVIYRIKCFFIAP